MMLASPSKTDRSPTPASTDATAQVPGMNWNNPLAPLYGLTALGSPFDSHSMITSASSTRSGAKWTSSRGRQLAVFGLIGIGGQLGVVVVVVG